MDKLDQFIAEMFSYYSKDVRSGAVNVYKRALKDIPLDQLVEMFDKHIADPDSGQFIPKVADFVRVNQGTKKGNAVAAWNKIYRAITEIGPYQSFVIDDPWAMKCIEEVGGFARLCELTDKDLDFKYNEFARLYESYRAQGTPDKFPSRVKGYIEKESGVEQETLLIGDESRAMRVMAAGQNRTGLNIKKLSLEKNDIVKSIAKIGQQD